MATSALSAYNERLFSRRDFESRESRLSKALGMFAAEPRRGRALDLAAGSGIAAEALARQGWTVSALDLSADLVERIKDRGIADVQRHDLSGGPLPFPDATFAAVFAGEIIEHLVDTAAFLREIARVLAPSGVVVVTTPNLASLENRLRLLLGRYPIWMEVELSDQGHVRGYTAPTLRAQLARAGLMTEETTGNFIPFLPQRFLHDVRLPPLARTGGWAPTLAQGLIVKARRM